MATVFVQGSSGSINKVDIPTDPHGAERFRDAIDKGTLVIIPDDRIAERISRHGGVIYVIDQSVPLQIDEPVDQQSLAPTGVKTPSKQDLFDRAQELGIETKASWSKAQLVEAISAHEATSVDVPGVVDPADGGTVDGEDLVED